MEMAQWIIQKAAGPMELVRWVWTWIRARSVTRKQIESARGAFHMQEQGNCMQGECAVWLVT